MKKPGIRGNIAYRVVPLTTDGEPDGRPAVIGTGDVELVPYYDSVSDPETGFTGATTVISVDGKDATTWGFDNFRFECYPKIVKTHEGESVSYGYVKAPHVRVITTPDGDKYLRLIPVNHSLLTLGSERDQTQEA